MQCPQENATCTTRMSKTVRVLMPLNLDGNKEYLINNEIQASGFLVKHKLSFKAQNKLLWVTVETNLRKS